MTRKVHVTVAAGPMKDKAFSFEKYDTFLFR